MTDRQHAKLRTEGQLKQSGRRRTRSRKNSSYNCLGAVVSCAVGAPLQKFSRQAAGTGRGVLWSEARQGQWRAVQVEREASVVSYRKDIADWARDV